MVTRIEVYKAKLEMEKAVDEWQDFVDEEYDKAEERQYSTRPYVVNQSEIDRLWGVYEQKRDKYDNLCFEYNGVTPVESEQIADIEYDQDLYNLARGR